MKFLLPWIAFGVAMVTGCGPPRQSAPAAPPYNTTLTLKQVMEWVIDPAADDVWESVAIIITEKGENQKAPKTDEEWAKVRNGAATLVESGNLLMTQTRVRDDKKWMASAKRMSDAGEVAQQFTGKRCVDHETYIGRVTGVARRMLCCVLRTDEACRKADYQSGSHGERLG